MKVHHPFLVTLRLIICVVLYQNVSGLHFTVIVRTNYKEFLTFCLL